MLVNIRSSAYTVSRFVFKDKPMKKELGFYECYHLDHYLQDSGYEYTSYVRTIEEINYLGGCEYGIADDLNQIKELYKKPIADKNRQFVIGFYCQDKSFWNNEKWYKSGAYIGIDESLENDVILYHIFEILKHPSRLSHLKNYIQTPFIWVRFSLKMLKINLLNRKQGDSKNG